MTIWALNARAEKHRTSTGIRLADTMIVSLPRDAAPDHHREMIAKIIADLGRDSDAWLIGAIHRDRAGNPHAHILAIDGLESEAAARKRRPDAQRLRRADALHLNQGGNRKELRAKIAAHINTVSERENYRRAEVRSYKDRGIQLTPGRHEGPKLRAINEKLSSWFETSSLETEDVLSQLPSSTPEHAAKSDEPYEDRGIREAIQDQIDATSALTSSPKRNNIRY